MKVLFVSAVLPYPLHSGGQIRIYNLLKRLSKRHAITLVSFIRNENEREYLPHLRFCKDVHVIMRGHAWQPKYYTHAVLGKYPFLLATYDNAYVRNTISRLFSEDSYDLIHIEPFYVMPSIPKISVPLVVSEHNVEYDVYGEYVRRFPIIPLRPLLAVDVWKLKFWEVTAWRKATALTAVSEDDATKMGEVSRTVTVVPNGVDLATFTYATPVKKQSLALLFVGNFRWLPNRDAATMLAQRIWPKVRESLPDSTLTIVGRNVPPSVKSAVSRAGGIVREDVTDIASCYREADILVAPHAIAGGTKFKMLEAMASGLPIITTREGASGLGLTPGKEYIAAENADDFVEKIRSLSGNLVLRQKLSKAARACIEKRYAWDAISDRLEKVWKDAV